MKKLIATLVVAACMVSFTAPVFADDAAKDQTIKGEACCAKCELHKADKCQTCIRVKNADGTETIYYAKNNDVAKAFHSKVCQAPAKVTAVGAVEEKGAKKLITLHKIDAE